MAYVHGPRGIHAVDSATGWTWPVQDALGSVRGYVGEHNVVVSNINYSEYGVPSTPITGFAFTGEMRDGNGVQYHRARYLSPALGGWLSLDPWEGMAERIMSMNGYAWVEGNSTNLTDSIGRCVEEDICRDLRSSVGIPRQVLLELGCIAQPELDCNCYANSQALALERYCSDGVINSCGQARNYRGYSQDAKTIASEADQFECLSLWVSREVGEFNGSGAEAQANALTWVILNRLAITINVLRADLAANQRATYGSVCEQVDQRAANVSSNVAAGIANALMNYRYKSSTDPTDGSLGWRHIPNCIIGHRGCDQEWEPECSYPKESVCIRINEARRPVESSVEFFRRHMRWASVYMDNNPGRNYFLPVVTSEEEAAMFDGQIYQLGHLAVFNRSSQGNENIYVVLGEV
jgi:RHS repeat-associated protein